ncbi:hypothetical protein ACIPTT_14345 [Pectobacterium versatile]
MDNTEATLRDDLVAKKVIQVRPDHLHHADG